VFALIPCVGSLVLLIVEEEELEGPATVPAAIYSILSRILKTIIMIAMLAAFNQKEECLLLAACRQCFVKNLIWKMTAEN
jgi:hypothetical protein